MTTLGFMPLLMVVSKCDLFSSLTAVILYLFPFFDHQY